MIKIETHPADNPLFGQSKWWGQPDMPEDFVYPEVPMVDEDGEEYEDPLTFVCQLRCEELAPFDPEGLLPHTGMLYFFAALDYFFGNFDTADSPGMGLWQKKHYKVMYSPTCDNLHTHSIVFEDGSPFGLPAESITFSSCERADDGNRLLGKPYLEEVCEEFPDMISLLQIDEEDRWHLVFYDCGMVNFLVKPSDLRERKWDKVCCHLYSF
ncbi:MAG: DUF1963 domain-containing protein [Bacteroidales bacterium]|nr:DUF1963 domain-containing protein [Bacteroidales bacterium]